MEKEKQQNGINKELHERVSLRAWNTLQAEQGVQLQDIKVFRACMSGKPVKDVAREYGITTRDVLQTVPRRVRLQPPPRQEAGAASLCAVCAAQDQHRHRDGLHPPWAGGVHAPFRRRDPVVPHRRHRHLCEAAAEHRQRILDRVGRTRKI